MERPTLYLFMGYPGAGKTTLAKLIEQHTGAIHLWVDRERRQMFGAEATHSMAESQALYDRLNTITGELLAAGKSVIYDTNFNYESDRKHMRALAADNNADCLTIWLTTDKELSKRRATSESHGRDTRVWGNMPDEVFDRIAGKFELPAEDKDVLTMDGTDLDPAEVARILGW